MESVCCFDMNFCLRSGRGFDLEAIRYDLRLKVVICFKLKILCFVSGLGSIDNVGCMVNDTIGFTYKRSL